MDRAARVTTVVCAAVAGFALAYALPPFTRLPNLFYDPIARSFHVGSTPTAAQMGYYGQVLYGALGGLALGVVTLVVTRRPSPSTITLGTAWALTFVALVAAYFAWVNWP